ncbi:hypothetical protein BDY19DRAFT_530357 [Irpex rosettiformis]|uniref:Uncharacterized protein n=1 Tax=Irpex rosettiformis TaxID=378272 RepID=A0ACB8TRI1_9APHY|nr:hypothetical protein BDY19DRAFT_530357 [Irpex rosettiformis]
MHLSSPLPRLLSCLMRACIFSTPDLSGQSNSSPLQTWTNFIRNMTKRMSKSAPPNPHTNKLALGAIKTAGNTQHTTHSVAPYLTDTPQDITAETASSDDSAGPSLSSNYLSVSNKEREAAQTPRHSEDDGPEATDVSSGTSLKELPVQPLNESSISANPILAPETSDFEEGSSQLVQSAQRVKEEEVKEEEKPSIENGRSATGEQPAATTKMEKHESDAGPSTASTSSSAQPHHEPVSSSSHRDEVIYHRVPFQRYGAHYGLGEMNRYDGLNLTEQGPVQRKERQFLKACNNYNFASSCVRKARENVEDAMAELDALRKNLVQCQAPPEIVVNPRTTLQPHPSSSSPRTVQPTVSQRVKTRDSPPIAGPSARHVATSTSPTVKLEPVPSCSSSQTPTSSGNKKRVREDEDNPAADGGEPHLGRRTRARREPPADLPTPRRDDPQPPRPLRRSARLRNSHTTASSQTPATRMTEPVTLPLRARPCTRSSRRAELSSRVADNVAGSSGSGPRGRKRSRAEVGDEDDEATKEKPKAKGSKRSRR